MPSFIRFLATTALSLALSAQALADPNRPKIGLVLGGGGARGAAHVGVLEVLEELKIPVDCIAGTSMGALVAGAYASGLTPAMKRLPLPPKWRNCTISLRRCRRVMTPWWGSAA